MHRDRDVLKVHAFAQAERDKKRRVVESAAAELLKRTRGDRADLERHQEPRVKNAEAALERPTAPT